MFGPHLLSSASRNVRLKNEIFSVLAVPGCSFGMSRKLSCVQSYSPFPSPLSFSLFFSSYSSSLPSFSSSYLDQCFTPANHRTPNFPVIYVSHYFRLSARLPKQDFKGERHRRGSGPPQNADEYDCVENYTHNLYYIYFKLKS